MQKQLFFLLVLIPFLSVSQDLIKTKEGVDIPCRLQSASPQLVKYINNNNLQSDSIITENVIELVYKDTLRVFVYPASERLKVDLIDEASYKLLFGTKDYGKILHSKTILSDVAFIGNTDNLTLDSKKKLTVSLATYKINKDIHWEVSAHTDTVGKVAINLAQSKARATAFRNYMEVQGFDFAHLTPIGKGESEPLFFKAGETIKNKRIELRATKIDKVGLLYWETYIPPKVIIPERAMVQAVEPVVASSIPTPSETTTQTYIKPKKKNVFSISLGVELNQALGSESNAWKSTEGIGILRSLGVSANFNFRFSKALGFVIQTGFSQFEVQRNYNTEGVLQFTANDKLQRIPIQLGFRIYPFANFYIQPSGGGQLLNLTSDTSEDHPNGKTSYNTSGMKLSYGGLVGYELHIKKIFLDISGQYQIIANKNFAGSLEALNFAGIRVGLGFDSK